MKKRSLVAALAMLMVSAIVLTSSTYAWFATGTTAKVSGINATVSNDQGNITISADGANYSTSLEYAQFEGQVGNYTPANFAPVSFNPSAETMVAGAITQGEDAGNPTTYGKMLFEPTLATNDSTKFIKLKVHLKASVDCTVNVAADMSGSTYQFIYAAIYDDSDTSRANHQVYNTASRSYQPITSATQGIDVNTDAIMTSADKAIDGSSEYSALGSGVTTSTSDPVAIQLLADQPKTITVYVWAEGNDSLCVGNITSQSCAVGLNFTKI